MNDTVKCPKHKIGGSPCYCHPPKPTLAQECNCPAYPEPHVAGLFLCQVKDTCKPICTACLNNCEHKACDDGIGPYEYWGHRAVNSRPYTGSDCCEADIIESKRSNCHKGTISPSIQQVLFKLLDRICADMVEDYIELATIHFVPAAAVNNPDHIYWHSEACAALYKKALELLSGYNLEELLND